MFDLYEYWDFSACTAVCRVIAGDLRGYGKGIQQTSNYDRDRKDEERGVGKKEPAGRQRLQVKEDWNESEPPSYDGNE